MAIAWTIATAGGDLTADSMLGELYTGSIGERIRPRFSVSKSAHDTLTPYVEAAMDQTIQTGVSQSGVAWYREDLSEFSITSLMISLEPQTSLSGAGVWAVIVGGKDRSNTPRTNYVWELECRVLADLDDYATRTDVENALKSEVL